METVSREPVLISEKKWESNGAELWQAKDGEKKNKRKIFGTLPKILKKERRKRGRGSIGD